MTIVRRHAKNTLTAIELNHGQTLQFQLLNREVRELTLAATGADLIETTLRQLKVEENAAITNYRFWCDLQIGGRTHRLEREVSTPASFYEPWEIEGMTIWFDAVQDIFEFLNDTHGGGCRPNAHARFAIQDATAGICPEALHPWCPLPAGGLRIENCYRGEDCWLGAYNGASAHGGLDLNHPRGTPLWAPLDIHDQFYFNSLEMGHKNNRWRGIHHWPNGAVWILQAHHMTELTVPEHTPVARGQQFAWGAGVLSGAVDHSHFVFKIHDEGETVYLDPWILFRQMYADDLVVDGR